MIIMSYHNAISNRLQDKLLGIYFNIFSQHNIFDWYFLGQPNSTFPFFNKIPFVHLYVIVLSLSCINILFYYLCLPNSEDPGISILVILLMCVVFNKDVYNCSDLFCSTNTLKIPMVKHYLPCTSKLIVLPCIYHGKVCFTMMLPLMRWFVQIIFTVYHIFRQLLLWMFLAVFIWICY